MDSLKNFLTTQKLASLTLSRIFYQLWIDGFSIKPLEVFAIFENIANEDLGDEKKNTLCQSNLSRYLYF